VFKSLEVEKYASRDGLRITILSYLLFCCCW